MVTVYVGGKRVGIWAEAEAAFDAAARTETIEFRDADGQVLATTSPAAEDPDWVKAITPEGTARRMA